MASKDISVLCSCHLSKQFTFTQELSGKPAREDAYFVQIACPFGHEKACKKNLTIELPTGVRPKESGTVFRE